MENSMKELLDHMDKSENEKIRLASAQARTVIDATEHLVKNVIPAIAERPELAEQWVENLKQAVVANNRRLRHAKLRPGGIIANRTQPDGSAKIEEGEFVINPKETSKMGQWLEKNL